MLGKFKDELTGEKKLIILYSILFVFNILLFINLFAYITVFRQLNFNAFHEVGTIIAAIIILGFISTRLPKLKESTDGSLYEIAYLIIIGILSITVSYFNKSTNGESLWAPFLEMFRMLAVMLILSFVATKSKSFQSLIEKKTSRKTQIWLIIIFGILGILGIGNLNCKLGFFFTQVITSLYASGTETNKTERRAFKSLSSTNFFTASNTATKSFANLSDSNKHFTTGSGSFLTVRHDASANNKIIKYFIL